MIQKNTPPASPDMNNEFEDEDMIYVGEVEEVIEAYDTENIEDEDSVEEDLPEKGDAICVFNGHKRGQENFNYYNNISMVTILLLI